MRFKSILKKIFTKREYIPIFHPISSSDEFVGKVALISGGSGGIGLSIAKSLEESGAKVIVAGTNVTKLNKISKEIEFKVSCSKGTYIRSLCTDIAKKMGTIGYMSGLERLKVGEFSIKNSIVIDDKIDKKSLEKHIITVEELFKDREEIELNSKKLMLFLNGVKLSCNNIDGVYRIYNSGKFIGLGVVKNGLLKRDIVL